MDAIRRILEELKAGRVDIDEVIGKLAKLPYEPLLAAYGGQLLPFARIDHHRYVRRGFAEVIYGEGKSCEHLISIVSSMVDSGSNVLITRVSKDVGEMLSKHFPEGIYNSVARLWVLKIGEDRSISDGYVAVISGGTLDIPVAEEAALTAEFMGSSVRRFYDVGVAGIHRLLDVLEEIRGAASWVVVAGMEGALPSVVGGLVAGPVVAVPTSVGYGTNFGGLASLLSALNSCSPGVVVVNIDNGFGAGYAASLIHRKMICKNSK